MARRNRKAQRVGRGARKARRVPRLEPRTPERDERHQASPTAVAAEALRSGVLPARQKASRIPHEDETIRVGDPDDDSLANEYVGEDVPGGSSPTPDQSNVDEIGRAYGLQDEDNGSLRTSREVLERRDRHRSELQPPRRPRP